MSERSIQAGFEQMLGLEDHIARLASRVAELEGERAKLIACVRAADLLMRLHSAPAIESLPGSYRTLREAYDAAHAEVEP